MGKLLILAALLALPLVLTLGRGQPRNAEPITRLERVRRVQALRDLCRPDFTRKHERPVPLPKTYSGMEERDN